MSTPIPEELRKAAQEHVQRWGGDERSVGMVAAAMAARDERAAKMIEEKEAFILSRQDRKNLAVDANLRMIACILPEIASAIRSKT